MHTCYQDILDLIDRDPIWFDEHAVPRFVLFSPKCIADIYADECALLEIACQACERPFLVAMSTNLAKRYMAVPRPECRDEFQRRLHVAASETLAWEISTGRVHYGDPPNVGCCCAGPTMNSVPRRVVEYWRRNGDGDAEKKTLGRDWERDRRLEVAIEATWAKDEG